MPERGQLNTGPLVHHSDAERPTHPTESPLSRVLQNPRDAYVRGRRRIYSSGSQFFLAWPSSRLLEVSNVMSIFMPPLIDLYLRKWNAHSRHPPPPQVLVDIPVIIVVVGDLRNTIKSQQYLACKSKGNDNPLAGRLPSASTSVSCSASTSPNPRCRCLENKWGREAGGMSDCLHSRPSKSSLSLTLSYTFSSAICHFPHPLLKPSRLGA
ncbi:hypothetical protein BDK51DRAFT_40209 [Blyttiomyces helicus]|uniref:Uncharacterized protein n=1 Tax=Blyttiomyces helicus TaxID=388810 RepID=A0A4P9WBX0_9FUNG|nr:hypothetical protein BDK51DRAFT_40209 [Blyttiomyces helicus]|eukprot:RKO89125.1 hypothetical protein BDK51DRAFT_40209 [Blyttiomyces helicus]